MKKVYCIIATYNGIEWIDYCLGSLKKSSFPVHIIAVDNASADGTPDIIETNYPEVEVIRLGTNSGFGAANNTGIKKAIEKGADYLFLLNMDARVYDNTIATLVDVAENHTSYGIISPMQLNGSGTGLDYLFSTYIDPLKCPGLLSDVYLNATKDIYEVQKVNAASWLIRADVIKRVGYFDNSFFMYGEDDNFGDRVTYNGYKKGVVPSAKICHARNQSTDRKEMIRTDTHSQIIRAKVTALDPNQSIASKLFYLFRKSSSYMLMNIQAGNIFSVSGNVKAYLLGIYYILRFDRKYKIRNKPVRVE